MNGRAGHERLQVVGRLLTAASVIGLGLGALLGFTAALVIDADLGLAVLGAVAGTLFALVAQLANVVALFLCRRFRPSTSWVGLRVVLLPVPAVAALLFAAFAVVNVRDLPDAARLACTVATAGLTAATAWFASSWCLAPLRLPRAPR